MMSMIYNMAMAAYDGAIRVAATLNPKAAKMVSGRRESLGILRDKLREGDRPIWFHAASLGEFEQARPVIEEIKRRYPGRKVVVSFFSPSGYEVRKDYPDADAVCYFPADTPGKIREFIRTMKPGMAVFVKYEFWRNALETLAESRVPTILISARFRPDQLFFKPWGGFYRKWLKWFSEIFVQDDESRKLLENIGVDNVTVAGDTRFDRVMAIKRQRREIPEAEIFKSGLGLRGMVLAAGSSWPQDEGVYAAWIRKHPNVKLILAPHEFDDARIKGLVGLFGRQKTVVLSEVRGRAEENRERLRDAQVLVIDCFGLLSSLYAYSDAAYIGGGFGAGIHNINEAAVYGIPVLFGPNNGKFLEAAELKENGGGTEIVGRGDFERKATRLLEDPAYRRECGAVAGNYIESRLGATEKIMNYLANR